MIFERLSGIETGQGELLEWIDGWLQEKESHDHDRVAARA